MLRCKFIRLEQDRSGRSVAKGARLFPQVLSDIERGRTNPTSDELKRLAKTLNFEGEPTRLLDHISAAPLGDGAEARDSLREAVNAD
jgi:transcriptional regulator with XRE-family HTH domain